MSCNGHQAPRRRRRHRASGGRPHRPGRAQLARHRGPTRSAWRCTGTSVPTRRRCPAPGRPPSDRAARPPARRPPVLEHDAATRRAGRPLAAPRSGAGADPPCPGPRPRPGVARPAERPRRRRRRRREPRLARPRRPARPPPGGAPASPTSVARRGDRTSTCSSLRSTPKPTSASPGGWWRAPSCCERCVNGCCSPRRVGRRPDDPRRGDRRTGVRGRHRPLRDLDPPRAAGPRPRQPHAAHLGAPPPGRGAGPETRHGPRRRRTTCTRSGPTCSPRTRRCTTTTATSRTSASSPRCSSSSRTSGAGTYEVPTYSAHLVGADQTEAYRYHRKVLQTLQRRAAPANAGCCKAPSHLGPAADPLRGLSRRRASCRSTATR